MIKVQAEPYDFEFDPKTAALLIIDMQRDFVYKGGFGEALGRVTIFSKSTERKYGHARFQS